MDKVKKERAKHKEKAVKFIQSFADEMIRQYSEPVREGVTKGDPIGFSSKKYRATFLLALNPNALNLKEIAKLNDTPFGVLRVWRTQENFKRETEKALKKIALTIWNTIENVLMAEEARMIRKKDPASLFSLCDFDGEMVLKKIKSPNHDSVIDEILLSDPKIKLLEIDENNKKFPYLPNFTVDMLSEFPAIFPFLNPLSTTPPNLKLIKEFTDKHLFRFAGLLLNVHKNFMVKDERSLKKFQPLPEIKDLFSASVISMIDQLADPEAWKQLGEEEQKKTAEELKQIFLSELK